VQDEVPACSKNGGFFKPSQLNDGGFAYIWYPLISLLNKIMEDNKNCSLLDSVYFVQV
jgi:hypothetical protein